MRVLECIPNFSVLIGENVLAGKPAHAFLNLFLNLYVFMNIKREQQKRSQMQKHCRIHFPRAQRQSVTAAQRQSVAASQSCHCCVCCFSSFFYPVIKLLG